MADLQELFSRLKAQSSDSPHSSPQAPLLPRTQPVHYQPPTVSSPLFSPPIHTPNPIHSSNVMSPAAPGSAVGTPAPDSNRTNLLNLLKFNGQSGLSQGQPGPVYDLHNIAGDRSATRSASNIQSGETRTLSASDVLATLQQTSSPSGLEKPATQTFSTNNQQNLLLNLLTKAQPIPATSTETTIKSESLAKPSTPAARTQAEGESLPIRMQFGSPQAHDVPFDAPQPARPTMFNYVNPFDQLHSSSPLNRNRTPLPDTPSQPKTETLLKHGRDTSANGESVPAAKSRKVDMEEPKAPRAGEAAPKAQSVSQALEGVGEAVDKQVEAALANADAKVLKTQAPPANEKPIVKNKTPDDVDSSWESAEDDTASGKDDFKVVVYNFPMRPFVSLQIKPIQAPPAIRQESFLMIAQLKKEFDQMDRSLVTASQTHIVYAHLATKKDNGGFRIIRQETGDHQHIFRSTGERIFNIQLCSPISSTHDAEAVLGTGVNGSVFWTTVSKSRGDLFTDDDIEAQGFILPPVNTSEENTSGSPVKTRAKMSCRHPEFFAVARGKQIFIIATDTIKGPAYCHQSTRKVAGEKYFADHTLKLNTGKAGKDFCFSEDDSVIVSLDKNGRCKFWDIRDLTSRASDLSERKHEPVELRDPIWTLSAATSADEKPSVSSIMLLDKERPMLNGHALRYLIIGFKQNHILQLWDLGLGKAVQEIRLPHTDDSDGICSISYHAKTGIVAIGHPTRNSIYFVHLSAPKYNIPKMEQARYVSMLARGDSAVPKPESTAIMSGLREFSFAKIGQLRSVDMLKTPPNNGSEVSGDDETLFELYVMHSKGVIGISIKRQDLGWDKNGKMLYPQDAVKEGVAEINDLVSPPKTTVVSEQSSNAESSKTVKPAPTKKTEPIAAVEVKKEISRTPSATSLGAARKEKAPEASIKTAAESNSSAKPPTPPDSSALAVQGTESNSNTQTGRDVTNGTLSTSGPSKPSASPGASSDAQALMSKHFESLYQRLDADKRVQDAAAGAKQDALLRLVSSTLTENVDQSLSDIIAKRIEEDVVPAISSLTSKAIDLKIGELLPQQLGSSLTAALKATLPNALQQTLQNREVHQTISNITANQVASKVQQQVSAMLQQSLPEMASKATQKMISDLEARTNEKLRQAEAQRRNDVTQIEELSQLVRSLSTTIQALADKQSEFQVQMLEMQREAKTVAPSIAAPESQVAPEDPEVAAMAQLLSVGKYEEATIQWISSDRQAEIFDKLFVRLNPGYLQRVSPLVGLTVSAAVTSSFDSFVIERLDWLDKVLASIDIHDDEIMDVAPKIMDVLSQRLQGAYMQIAEANPSNPALRKISTLSRQVSEIRRL